MTQDLLGDREDQSQIDPNKNYLEELVGDNKKFKSVEDLARGKYEADLFIATKNEAFDDLKKDYLKLREEYEAVPRLQTLIDQMAEQQLTNRETNTHNSNVQPKETAIDMTKVEELLQQKLKQHEDSKTEDANFNTVMSKLKEKWGDNYSATLKHQMDTLGLDKEFVNDLAKKHPQVLLKTLGVDQQQSKETFDSPIRNQTRSDNFAPSTNKRTWSFYQEMKKKNPSQYLDSKTQVQMLRDRTELGDAFKDGDYNN